MLLSVLCFIILLLAEVTSLTTISPLQSSLHQDLFTDHNLLISNNKIWLKRHEEAYLEETFIEDNIPVLYCEKESVTFEDISLKYDQSINHTTRQKRHENKVLSIKEEEVKKMVGEKVIARVDHENKETCYLLYMTSTMMSEAKEGWGWNIAILPPLLKIHPSVFQFFDDSVSSIRSTKLTLDENDGSSRIKNKEEMELVVQFMPHASSAEYNHDTQKVMTDVIEQWSTEHNKIRGHNAYSGEIVSDSTATHNDDVGISWLKHRENTLRQMSLQPYSTHLYSMCQLPSSVQYEHTNEPRYGGDIGRVVGLQNAWHVTDEGTEENEHLTNYCFMILVEALSLHPDVLSISVLSRMKLMNSHARGILQSGESGNSPLTAAGLLGVGQVVGVADTGLDDLSCFFYDNTQYYSTTQTSRDGTVESHRRKVVQYKSYGDSYDHVAGHGSHVVGSIVGESISQEYSFANGAYIALSNSFLL